VKSIVKDVSSPSLGTSHGANEGDRDRDVPQPRLVKPWLGGEILVRATLPSSISVPPYVLIITIDVFEADLHIQPIEGTEKF
jgi:hypothetical protein